jgi:hypothetical protein
MLVPETRTRNRVTPARPWVACRGGGLGGVRTVRGAWRGRPRRASSGRFEPPLGGPLRSRRRRAGPARRSRRRRAADSTPTRRRRAADRPARPAGAVPLSRRRRPASGLSHPPFRHGSSPQCREPGPNRPFRLPRGLALARPRAFLSELPEFLVVNSDSRSQLPRKPPELTTRKQNDYEKIAQRATPAGNSPGTGRELTGELTGQSPGTGEVAARWRPNR